MSSTYSTNLGIELIGTGDQAGTWGTTTNTNLGTLIEQAISGYFSYSCTGGTDVLTITGGVSSVARNMYLQLSGTGGGTVLVPSNQKLYFIYNSTASPITVKVSGQTGVSIPAGRRMSLVCDGTDVVQAANYMVSPTFVTPALGTPASGTLTNCTGLPLTTGVAGTLAVANGGTGVTTSTGTGSTVLSTSPTLVTPLLGTPTSGTLTNCTGLPLTTGVTGTLPIANGGTGLSSTPTNGQILIGNSGTNSYTLSTLSAGTGCTIVNSPGGITINATGTGGSVTSVGMTVPAFLTVTGSPVTTTGTLAVSYSGTALPLANGGTGDTTASGAATNLGLGTTSSVRFGSLGVGTAASGVTGEIRAFNNVTAYYSSDRKFKENIKDIDNAAAKVKAIGGKTFDWTDEYIADHGGEDGYFVQKQDFGVIAQDVQAAFPMAVKQREDGSLAVDYQKLSALALAAIAELTARVEALENK